MKYRSDKYYKRRDDRRMSAKALEAGAAAFSGGVPRELCPYQSSGLQGSRRTLEDEQRSAWLFGWLMAKKKAQREQSA